MNCLLREFAVSCCAGTVVVVAYLTAMRWAEKGGAW